MDFDEFLNQVSLATAGIGETVTDVWGTAREIGATVNPPAPVMTTEQVEFQNRISANATTTQNTGNMLGIALLGLGFWIISKAL